MMAGPRDAPLMVLHLYTEATLPIALILQADKSLRSYGFGQKILLTKGIVLDSEIHE